MCAISPVFVCVCVFGMDTRVGGDGLGGGWGMGWRGGGV